MSTKLNEKGFVGYLLLAIPIIMVLFFLLCFRTVGVGQVGLVTRFGRITREQNSGIVMKLPWPIERLNKLDVKVQKEQVKATAATKDLQDVNTTIAVNYSLENSKVRNLFETVGSDYKERIVLPAVQETFKATSARYTASELLTSRQDVKNGVVESLRKRMSLYGIYVQDVSIVNFSFSREFTNAIEKKQVAAQQAEQAKFGVQKAKAEAEAAIERAKGQAQAQKLVRSSASPEVLKKLAIEKWDGKLPNYLGGGTVFNIPLR